MTGRNDAEPVAGPRHLHAEAPQEGFDLAPRDLDAQDPFDPGRIQQDAGANGQVVLLLRQDPRSGTPPRDVQQQLRRAFHGALLQPRVDAALESLRRIGVHPEAPCTAGHRLGREVRDLQEDVAGVVGDAALEAAHHAGNADCRLGIGDHQDVRLQRDLLPVQQLQALAVPGMADLDAVLQAAQVVRVHRLAEFEHDVVGDVHHRTHRPQAGTAQALHHPQRRGGPGRYATNHPSDEPGARRRCGKADLEALACRRRHGLDLRQGERQAAQGRHFPRHAGHAQGITAVRGQAQLQHRVVEAQGRAHVLARLEVLRQVEDAFVAVPHAELARRAQHACRLDAAQFRAPDLHAPRKLGADPGQGGGHAGPRVGRPAHDLDGLRPAVVDRADRQLVRIGMRPALQHAGHDHALERRGGAFDRLDLEAGHRQPLRQRVGVPAGANPLRQPCSAHPHAVTPG